MKNKDCNKDEGIITGIDGNYISLHIAQNESCTGCAATSLCEKTSNNGKDLTISQNNASAFQVGEKVSVLTPQNKVMKAIGLAFAFPTLLVVLFCLLQYFFFPLNDTLIALGCLLILITYFWILYINRNKSTFNFSIFIEKIS
ncbi:MAG: SoxR reducing system RseC family protein [Bacteroidales bacterium]|nr:SoxR reducing system RseC family protein [Bacteroidales bacterium]